MVHLLMLDLLASNVRKHHVCVMNCFVPNCIKLLGKCVWCSDQFNGI